GAEIASGRVGPPLDAPYEPPARRDDLPAGGDDLPVELDLPQLVVRPERQVLDPAGVHAAFAGRRLGSLDPALGLPAEAGERAERPGAEERVGGHDREKLLNAAQSSSSSCGDGALA